MEKYIELSNEEIRLGFVSTCIESVAAALKRPYHEVFLRMKKTGMIRDYIYHCYDALHSDNLENVTAELIGLLKKEKDRHHGGTEIVERPLCPSAQQPDLLAQPVFIRYILIL